MDKKLRNIVRALSMIHAKRHVNIRGYVVEVTVSHKTKKGEWVCKTAYGKYETVPEHLFYHEAPGGLVMRDTPEFNRKYPNFPVSIVKLPTMGGQLL